MREQLIRYLLGELDSDERRELRAQLRESPELQRELEQLRACISSNHGDDEDWAPCRLAERTADRISNSDEYELEAALAKGSSRSAQLGDAPTGVLGWSLADLTVAGGVMLAVSMLVFPALRDSRDGTRSDTCKWNLIEMYRLVSQHAIDHGGRYPQVRPNERVGVIVARLVAKGYGEPEHVRTLMLCPASPQARELRASPSLFFVPTRDQMLAMTPAALSETAANFPRCYAWRMPQVIGNEYVDAREIPMMCPLFDPIFGDMPGDPNDPTTPVHRGSVIQLMNRDGRIICLNMQSPPAFGNDKDLYRNLVGVIAAGIGPHDVVLAPANATPGIAIPHDR